MSFSLVWYNPLDLQQLLFEVDARGVACERAVGTDDAMARDDDGDGVTVYGLTDGLS